MLKNGRTHAIGPPDSVLTELTIQEAFGLPVQIIQPGLTPYPVIVPNVVPVYHLS
ncbi:hypothetical protein D3C87_1792000 [compost metagenome]